MPDIFIPKENTNPAPHPIPTRDDAPQNGEETHIPQKISVQKSAISPFTTYKEFPVNVSFHNQDHDETILLFLRKHFVTNVSWIFTTFVLLILPFLILLLSTLTMSLDIIPFISFTNKYFVIFILFYYLIVFTFVFTSFITWFYNVSIVTQKRVVDIDYSDLVYHNVAMTKLNLIEDVDYTQSGFIRSFFGYGDVFVQTAGETKHFDFLAVPKPAKVVAIIEDLIGKGRHG